MKQEIDRSKELENALIVALNKMGDISVLNTIIDTGIINEGILQCGVEMFASYSTINEVEFINSQKDLDKEKSKANDKESDILEMIRLVSLARSNPIEAITKLALKRLEKIVERDKLVLTIKETVELILLVGTTEIKQYLENRKITPNPICGHEIKEFELYYHCKTCDLLEAKNLLSVICNECFYPEIHSDHDYEFRIDGNAGGCCDCGDRSCLDANCFCRNHSMRSSIIVKTKPSAYIEDAVKPLLLIVMSEYNKLLVNVSDKLEPNDDIVIIFQKLKFLFDIDNLAWIEPFIKTFLFCPKNVSTSHCCDPYSLNPSQENKKHVCTCSIFDNIIRSLPHIRKENHFVTKFLSEACKSFKIFRNEFIKSYFKVYRDLTSKYILRNEQGKEFMLKILGQSTWEDKPLIQYFSKHYAAYWIPTLNQIREILFATPTTVKTIFLMLIYSEEFKYILTNDTQLCLTIFSDELFLNTYLSVASDFTFFDNITKNLKEKGTNDNTIDNSKLITFYFFRKIFDYSFQKYNLGSQDINRRIFKVIYRKVKEQIESKLPKINEYNSFNLLLFRIFITFILKFFIKLIPKKDELTVDNFIIKLKIMLKEELNLDSVELEKISKGICIIILKELQYLTELEAKCTNMHPESVNLAVEFYFSHEEELNYASDLSLFQFFVLFVDEKEIISLFKVFIGKDEDIFQLVANDNNRKSLYLEAIIFRWMCLIRDDLSAVIVYYKAKYETSPNVIPEEDVPYFEYLLRKYAAMKVMKNEKNFDCFSEEMIKEDLPSVLKDNSEKIKIKHFFKSITIGKKVSLICDDSSIQFLNFFNYHLVKDIVIAESNTNIMINKKQLLPLNIYQTNVNIPLIFDLFYRSVRMKLTNRSINEYFAEFILKQKFSPVPITDFTQELFTAHFFLFENKIHLMKKDINKHDNELAKSNEKDLNLNLNLNLDQENLKNLKNMHSKINDALIMLEKKEVKSPFLKILLEELDLNSEGIKIKKEKEKETNKNDLKMNQKFKSKQEQMKEKILEQMKNQREKFKKNNAPEESKENHQKSNQNLCVVCKEELKDTENEEDAYGELSKFGDSNIMKYIMQYSIKLLSKDINNLENELNNEDSFKDLNIYSVYLHSCGHLIHIKCFKATLDSQKMCLCPLCGYFNNIVLPRIQNPRGNYGSSIFVIQLIFEFIRFSEFIKTMGNSKEGLESDLVKSYLSTCYSMISSEEILGLRPSSLKIVSTLQHFLFNILSFGKKEERKGIYLNIMANVLSTMDNSWNSNPVLYTFSNLLYEFLKIFFNNENFDYLELNQKLDQIIINSLDYLIQRMLLLTYCKIKKDRFITFEEFQKFSFNEDLINNNVFTEINRYLKKILLMKEILLISSECPQNFIAPYNETIVNIYHLEDKILFTKISKLINLTDEKLNEIFRNAISGIHLLQSNKELLAEKITKSQELINLKQNKENLSQIKFKLGISFFLNSANLNFQIFELPNTFDKLVFKYAFQNCRKCQKNCKNKCICLICGEIVCANSMCCMIEKNKGEVRTHANQAHFGFSYFLNIYRAEIIAISANIGTLIKNLYINESEEDINSKFDKRYNFISSDCLSYHLNTNVFETLRENIIRSGIFRNILKIILKEEGIQVVDTI